MTTAYRRMDELAKAFTVARESGLSRHDGETLAHAMDRLRVSLLDSGLQITPEICAAAFVGLEAAWEIAASAEDARTATPIGVMVLAHAASCLYLDALQDEQEGTR